MKKTIILIISILLVTSFLTVISASAYVPEWIADKGYLYAEKFFENWSEEDVAEFSEDDERLEYQELYYHHDENNEIDWVLVKGNSVDYYEDGVVTSKFGPYFLSNGRWENTFLGGLGVYDVKQDKFVDVTNDSYWCPLCSPKEFADYRDYDGFLEALESVEWPDGHLHLYPAGDMDGDDELTILDATDLQRWLAELDEPVKRIIDCDLEGDFDEDGDVTILDATAIQRYLVGLSDW